MWTAIVHIITGLWLMVMPDVLRAGDSLADSNHIAGPVIVTIGIIGMWDVNKSALKANILASVWLIIAPLFIPHNTIEGVLNISAGVLLIGTTFIRRKDKFSYGGGWGSLFRRYPPHMESGKQGNDNNS